MMRKTKITTYSGMLTSQSKQSIRELFSELPEGSFEVVVLQVSDKFTASRYKYYFDCVLRIILDNCGNQHQIASPTTGMARPVQTTEELHWVMKCIYNPVVFVRNGRAVQMPGSTRDLSDRAFAGQFVEQIISDYSSPPYLCEFPTIQEWAQMHKAGLWSQQFKK